MSVYDGIQTGPSFEHTYEAQEDATITGVSPNPSPFTIRMVVPDALLQGGDQDVSVDIITAASKGLSSTVDRVRQSIAVGGTPGALSSFVSEGRFLTGTSLFQSSIVDARTAADVSLQVQKMLDCPPLTLLVNPTEMSINYTKVQSYQSKTRYGYVYESWGEEQDRITFSGTTGGFVSRQGGYTFASRRSAASWHNFTELMQFYKNNGYVYDTIGKSYAHLFVGSLAIDYDQWTYVGHIESLSYTLDDSSPHKVAFEMEFTVSRKYDTHAATSAIGLMHPAGSSSTFSSDLSSSGYGRPDDSVLYAQPFLEDLGG